MSDESAGTQGAGAGAGDDGDRGTKTPVPYERFAASRTEVRALKAEIEGLRGKAGQVDGLAKERDEAKAALAAAQIEHGETVALLRAGVIDDEGAAVARTLYGRLPAENRPALGDWLTAMRAEGAQVPRALAPYLGQQQAPAGTPASPPRPARPGGSPPPSGGLATDALLRAARERGDHAELARLLGPLLPAAK